MQGSAGFCVSSFWSLTHVGLPALGSPLGRRVTDTAGCPCGIVGCKYLSARLPNPMRASEFDASLSVSAHFH